MTPPSTSDHIQSIKPRKLLADPAGPREEKLAAIAGSVRICTRCRLCQSRAHAVPGEGNPRTPIFFLGEAPGRYEDAAGRPFQFLSGREFDALLALAGMRRENIFVTGIVKCRPPDNRRPRRDEMDTCRRAHFDRQLAAIQPRLVVLLGAVATEEMLGQASLKGLLGRLVERDGRRYFVTYHPAASMRFPAAKRAARRHFARLPEILGSL